MTKASRTIGRNREIRRKVLFLGEVTRSQFGEEDTRRWGAVLGSGGKAWLQTEI